MELRRVYSTQEGLVRYWADQALELCHDVDDDELAEYVQVVNEAREHLKKDRRIIAIGGAGSGKSALLAGLAGVPAIARYEREEPYVCWRYVCRDADATCSRFLPRENLYGLELVDTADCGGEAAELCRTLLQGADVVVAVVDGRSPQSSPVWELLAELPEKNLNATLLAVTHTDMLGAEQGLRLKDQLREISREKLRYPLPPYYVCPADARGVETFRSRVQESMLGPQGVRAAIRALAEVASDLVDKQGRILRARRMVSLTSNSFISGIDQEIDNILAFQMRGLEKLYSYMQDELQRAVPPLLQRVRRHFGLGLSPSTLLRLELLGADTDRALYCQMERQVQSLQAETDEQFAALCLKHWDDVRPRMKKTIECEIGEFPAEALGEELESLRKRFSGDLYDLVSGTGMRHKLYELFMAQAGWMRACLIFLCFLLTAGGVLGFVGQDMPAVCCVSAAALVWLGGAIGCQVACCHICRNLRGMAESLRGYMGSSLRGALERLIVSRVAAYRRLYTAPRRKVSRQNETLEPLQLRQKEIYLQLRTLIPRL